MPKLPVTTAKKLIKVLERLGFQLDHKTGSHFIFYDSRNKRRVVVPFHTKDLPKGTILNIIKHAGINKKELEENL